MMVKKFRQKIKAAEKGPPSSKGTSAGKHSRAGEGKPEG